MSKYEDNGELLYHAACIECDVWMIYPDAIAAEV